MTENNEISPEELPEDVSAEPTGEEKFVELKEEFEETLADPALETAEIPPHPEANLSDIPEEAPTAEDELAEVKEPTKFQLFLRRTLIWFGVVLVFFAAGFATFYFVLHQPKVAELEDLQTQVVALEAEIKELDAEKIELEADSAALKDAENHTALLMVMVDAYDARFALGEENVVAAKSALSGTDAVLDKIFADIRGFDSGLADTLPQRLELIRTNLDRDVETAIEDCNQLIEDLLAVEEALYP